MPNTATNVRIEVMNFLGEKMDSIIETYLLPIDTNWQPADILPNASSETFFDEVRALQEAAKELPYDYLVVLIGDAITEEALPTYESWLMTMRGIEIDTDKPTWSRWVRGWTAEENRHGDLLNKYLYLSGRVNMREMETSIQYLLADGFDLQTTNDPYRSFVYTSFQELATNLSHRRTATLARRHGNTSLARMCGMIAGDEFRHASAYQSFVSSIFEVDSNEMMLAFEDMMRKRIVMPAHFLRETGLNIGATWSHFSDAAQRLGVYTTADYIDIMEQLIAEWKIDSRNDLNDSGKRARDYIMNLPSRMRKVAERTRIPNLEYSFNWIG